MSSRSIEHFATPEDVVELAGDVSRVRPLTFVEDKAYRAPFFHTFDDPNELRQCTRYLAFWRGTSTRFRAVPQRRGGVHYFVEPDPVSGAIELSLGGILKDGRHMTFGRVATVHKSKESTSVMRLFFASIRKNWERIQEFYVGPNAAALMDQGVKLIFSSTPPLPWRKLGPDVDHLRRES